MYTCKHCNFSTKIKQKYCSNCGKSLNNKEQNNKDKKACKDCYWTFIEKYWSYKCIPQEENNMKFDSIRGMVYQTLTKTEKNIDGHCKFFKPIPIEKTIEKTKKRKEEKKEEKRKIITGNILFIMFLIFVFLLCFGPVIGSELGWF